ncbi:MAG: hypothetical protein WBK77_02990 [Alphaproteobacteria bacterium]
MANMFDGITGGALNILGAARSFYPGIGLSRRAHDLSAQFLGQSASSLNKILSLNVSGNATNEAIQLKILAIRSSLPESQLSESVRGLSVDTEA